MIKSKPLVSNIDRPSPDTASRSNLLRLDRNERTTLFSDDEFNEMMKSLSPYDLVAYGELEPFYKSVIDYLKIERSKILITPGSDQGIKQIFETFISEGDQVINYVPNYAMFSVYCKMFGGVEIIKSFNKELGVDIDELLNSINGSTRMVIISNPGHNGVLIPEEQIIMVLQKALKYNTIVLIDEAYVDFVKNDMLRYIDEYENLIIVRTMSKAFGLASLRIGFILACSEIISQVYKVKPVHEIDGIASKIGKFLIEHPSIKDRYVEDVNKGKEILYNRLKSLGCEIKKSDTNFIFFQLDPIYNTEKVLNSLKNIGIHIKSPFNVYPINNFLRVTVGNPAQMITFCNELEGVLKGTQNNLNSEI